MKLFLPSMFFTTVPKHVFKCFKTNRSKTEAKSKTQYLKFLRLLKTILCNLKDSFFSFLSGDVKTPPRFLTKRSSNTL